LQNRKRRSDQGFGRRVRVSGHSRVSHARRPGRRKERCPVSRRSCPALSAPTSKRNGAESPGEDRSEGGRTYHTVPPESTPPRRVRGHTPSQPGLGPSVAVETERRGAGVDPPPAALDKAVRGERD